MKPGLRVPAIALLELDQFQFLAAAAVAHIQIPRLPCFLTSYAERRLMYLSAAADLRTES